MKFVAWGSLLAAALVLSACGGGGSSGDNPYSRSIDPGLLSRPIDLGGKQPDATTPSTPMSLAVTVNGTVATPDTTGQVSVKPGDVVSLVPNQSANWTTTAAPTEAVSLRNPQTAASLWSARLVNETTTTASYAVKASSAADGTQVKSVTFNIAAGDARNGSYKVFASNGSKQNLSINFDLMSYDMADNLGTTSSNDIAADASQAGTYVFRSTFNTAAVNNARFRVTTDAIVGSFPFASTSGHVVQPFVASRAPVTTQSELDGTYLRFGIDIVGSTRTPRARQVRVSGGGTKLEICNESGTTTPIQPVVNCSGTDLLTYDLSATATAGSWRAQDPTDSSNWFTFSMAKVGGKNVYLDAGVSASDPSMSIFRIGLGVGSPWPLTTAMGGDSDSTWGTLAFDVNNYAISLTSDTGTVSTASYAVDTFFVQQVGMAIIDNPTVQYFAAQDGTLSVVTGIFTGYLQIGLVN